MPYKSEKIKLKPSQDRRRKLSDEQIEEIKIKYETGNYSWQKLADEYGVSKSRIGMIVNTDRNARVKQRMKDHWKDYHPDKDVWAAVQKEHRRYKQNLYLMGQLKIELAEKENENEQGN